MYTHSGKKVRFGLIIAIVCGIAVLTLVGYYVYVVILTNQIRDFEVELSQEFVASYDEDGGGRGTKATYDGVSTRLSYSNSNHVFTALMNRGLVPSVMNTNEDDSVSIWIDFGNGNTLQLVRIADDGVFGRFFGSEKTIYFSTNDTCRFSSIALLVGEKGLSYPNELWVD